MTTEEKIVDAVRQMQKGCPLKDFLTDSQIEEAVTMLADILIVAGGSFNKIYEYLLENYK
jgi:hypothetical protein